MTVSSTLPVFFCCAATAPPSAGAPSSRRRAHASETSSACARARLGEANWRAFVRYAEAYHKAAFFNTLTPPDAVLRCAGKLDGAPCPKHLCLTTTSLCDVARTLETFHMDHTHDAAHICQVWSDALPPNPTSWDDGLCGPLVAHLLFGTRDHPMADASTNPLWKKQIVVRCGNRRGVAGQHAADFCHDVAHAHYTHTLRVEDLKLAAEPEETTVREKTAAGETAAGETAAGETTAGETTAGETEETLDDTTQPDDPREMQPPPPTQGAIDLTLEDGLDVDNAIDLTM